MIVNQIESRVPYWTNKEFTAAVVGVLSSSGMPMNSDNMRYVSDSLARKKQSELGYETPQTAVDIFEGQSNEISMGEARIVREEFAKGYSAAVISDSMKLPMKLIVDIIEGKIWPYAGGPLKPLTGIGLNETGYTANQRKFTGAVLRLVKREFPAHLFDVVCDNNGLLNADVMRLIMNLEHSDGRETANRRRSILLSHAKGEDVEKCAAAFRRRDAKPSA